MHGCKRFGADACTERRNIIFVAREVEFVTAEAPCGFNTIQRVGDACRRCIVNDVIGASHLRHYISVERRISDAVDGNAIDTLTVGRTAGTPDEITACACGSLAGSAAIERAAEEIVEDRMAA